MNKNYAWFYNNGIRYLVLLLLFLWAPKESYSQTLLKITGTVSDVSGPLPGVSVTVKGSTKGAITTTDGKYTIEALATDTLHFSNVGYLQQDIAVANRQLIDVLLTAQESTLNEVVVVAFGTQKKTELVGAVSTVKPSDLKVPSSNLTTALAGRIAGMIAYQRSGEPGADNADFFIRGVTTFGYKKDPLILIDNIEVSRTDMARLQVDDIASFSIMKDATSTALYGARGANGVILITTKEGKEGKASISARIENTVSSATRNVELVDPIRYMELANEAVLTRNPLGAVIYPYTKIANTKKGENPNVYPAVDWQKELLKNYTTNQRANLNVSGGGKVARYYIAGTMNLDRGILKVDQRNNFNSNANLKTYSIRSNININLTKTTEVLTRLSGSFDDYTGPINGGASTYIGIMHTNPVRFPAYFPVDSANRFVQHIMFGNYANGSYRNPYADLQRGYKDYSRSTIEAQFQVKQDLSFVTPGLNARVMFNTSRYSYFDVSRFYNPFYYEVVYYDKLAGNYNLGILNEDGGTEYLGYAEGRKDVSSTVYGEAAINYAKVFNQKHSFSGMLVGIMRNYLVGNAGDLQNSLPFRNLGLSGRTTYTYASRYSVEFNFGYNGSERFYKTNRFGFFPSVGVAWNLSNESFMKPLSDKVADLKLRATYGLVGNDAIGSAADRFFYLSNVNMNNGDFAQRFGTDFQFNRNGISISRYPNLDISWEAAKKFNLGIEARILKNINLQADYFREDRTDILMDRASIPSTMGLSAPIRANVGRASAHGIDGSLDFSHNIGTSLWIKARGNFTYAKSRFKVFEEPEYNEKYKSRVGYSLSQQWGYLAERLFVDNEETEHSPRQNFGQYGGGDIKYKDVNGDGVISELDQVPIGHPTDPEIVYGLGFSAGFKNLDVSCFFQGVDRTSFWIDAWATSPFIDGQRQMLKAYGDSHWSEENQDLYALWPRLSNTYNENNLQQSTWFMRNGAFLRLKQVEVGYSFRGKWANSVGIANARLYVNGTNLLTFSHFKLWDVEMGGNGLGYPIQRVFNLGLQVSFK